MKNISFLDYMLNTVEPDRYIGQLLLANIGLSQIRISE